MTKQELTKGTRAWCWWKSRTLYFTGLEYDKMITDRKTGTREKVHFYKFRDICDAITMITDDQLTKLEKR